MSDRLPTVFLVDDEPEVLKAVARLLRAEGIPVSAFSSPREFLDQVDPDAPGCLVLDMSMPAISGLEVQRELETRGCRLPVVFLTGRADVPDTVRAMKGGASDFLTKPVEDEELLGAVRRAIEKDAVLRRERAEEALVRARLETLTPREREVLEHVVAGELNKQIAGRLGTVEKTIKVHRARVMEKMQASSLADLVRLARRVRIGPR
jgi:FixJ family two-component response regulator